MAKRKPHWAWTIVGFLAVTAAIGAAYEYRQLAPYGRVGTAYLAKQYCSCRYVAGRSDQSCHAEFKPDIDRFHVTAEQTPASGAPSSATVTARMLVWSGEARFTKGFGCSLVK